MGDACLAWNCNLKPLICESDALEVVNVILGITHHNFHPYAKIALQVRSLLDRDWDVILQHVPREANDATDTLASLSFTYC
ncbi:Ribonuclease H-like superfamily [Sesbania bispinosa]|nr:Ribonuclease H-like superfamily [Sesbania bispinosa]